ncbi:hypothetical protein WJ41_00160 [Burkholderia ubonensis]|uniref:Beta-ketoacyl-[acyl-carrier-protein] synthase III N-terminal domain-containing protein n=1 Tax=Burkholderia ubonensis TaxID=101571 RepID=A0ABD4E223_9BURK|nr:hypothetical protein [Burkholderia ubonensis]KVH74718.1 hypothetical protein WJ41_00160 [Burkholderia ubonensis]KVN86032.1 hypothetical protein WJ68_11940 [Burkholderia ubonensis]KVN95834.1 hypothetical protein WJ71_31640 [Burkholderia ubonensis]KVO21957.1 hypothetical protein WJ73_33455 [Burkholderia ubonensis]KVO30853.1 hypothetical protein WJ74_22215 [Burkholderia ubonensis]
MKILGAAVALPGAATAAQPYANDYAVNAARQALLQAGCLPSELDLIVSLSISPSRLADAPSIAGPRLAHPVQRDLRARHAVVFDLLDADWTLALDLAQSHCRQLGYRRALVVRAEALADVEQVATSGFADGAGAIVLTPSGHDRGYASSYADLESPPFATLDALPARRVNGALSLARFESRFDHATGRFDGEPANAAAAVRAVVDEVQSRTDRRAATLFCESWLSGWPSIAAGAEGELPVDVVAGSADIPNPFQLPAWLASRVADSKSLRDDEHTVVAMTLDPFRPRIACSTMEV